MREQGELAYENLNMMLTVQKLTKENQRLRAVEEAHTEWCAARAALFTKSTPEGWTRLANAEHALYALK